MTAMRQTLHTAYTLATSVQAKRVVQIGGAAATSVALARAVHANTGGRGGLVLSMDLEGFAAERSRIELERAGVADYVCFVDGDPRCELQDLEGPFDLLWLDCESELAADVLSILKNRLRRGALVVGAELVIENEGSCLHPPTP